MPPLTGNPGIDARLLNWLASYDASDAFSGCDICIGGSTHPARLLSTRRGLRLFLKWSDNMSATGSFRQEALALERLGAHQVLQVPEVLSVGDDFLLLAAFVTGAPAADWPEAFGRGLAQLHQQGRNQQFGFDQDNLLGLSLQPNGWLDDWTIFWRERRLLPQLYLLESRLPPGDRLLQRGFRLAEKLEDILSGSPVQPVLLHGDLWSGNAAADAAGRPVIFDPASYYGSHEAEFGIMRLFAGFDPRCESAYIEILPFAAGHERRIAVYRLYHEINHLLLFGSSYYRMAAQTLDDLL